MFPKNAWALYPNLSTVGLAYQKRKNLGWGQSSLRRAHLPSPLESNSGLVTFFLITFTSGIRWVSWENSIIALIFKDKSLQFLLIKSFCFMNHLSNNSILCWQNLQEKRNFEMGRKKTRIPAQLVKIFFFFFGLQIGATGQFELI